MIWGVVVGTYSSFFIATPILLILGTAQYGQGRGQGCGGSPTLDGTLSRTAAG